MKRLNNKNMNVYSQTSNETIFDYEEIDKPFGELYSLSKKTIIVIQMKEPAK